MTVIFPVLSAQAVKVGGGGNGTAKSQIAGPKRGNLRHGKTEAIRLQTEAGETPAIVTALNGPADVCGEFPEPRDQIAGTIPRLIIISALHCGGIQGFTILSRMKRFS